MKTFKSDDETCSKCGSIYEVEGRKLPVRDNDTYKCQVCGGVLRSGNDTVAWSYTLKKKGKPGT